MKDKHITLVTRKLPNYESLKDTTTNHNLSKDFDNGVGRRGRMGKIATETIVGGHILTGKTLMHEFNEQ